MKDFVIAVELLESYVFRRSVCAMQTRNLAQIFASLAYRIREDAPLLSLKVALRRQGKKRRFPSDVEFREALETRDVYDMRNCHYLLDRLENESKEKIDTERFTIEHVMPQNESLSPEWQAMLGEDWQNVQQLWLHRLGNLTLTGYNPEYRDRSFTRESLAKGLLWGPGCRFGQDRNHAAVPIRPPFPSVIIAAAARVRCPAAGGTVRPARRTIRGAQTTAAATKRPDWTSSSPSAPAA